METARAPKRERRRMQQRAWPKQNKNKNNHYSDGITSSYAVEGTSEATTAAATKTDTPLSKFQVNQHVYARDPPYGSLYEAVVQKIDYAPRYTHSNNCPFVAQIHQEDDDEDIQKKKIRALHKLLKELDPSYEISPDLLSDDEQEYTWHYFVHYQGWNVRWDRWLDENSLYQLTPKMRDLVNRLNAELKMTKALGKNISKSKKEDLLAIIQTRMSKLEEAKSSKILIKIADFVQFIQKHRKTLGQESARHAVVGGSKKKMNEKLKAN